MSKIDEVKLSVPADAVYVTLASALVVTPPSPLLTTETFTSISVSVLASRMSPPMEIVYFLHNGRDIKLIRNRREIFSTPMTNVEKLHRFYAGGFVLHLKDGRGIALSTPTPVQTDASTTFRTVHGVTDLTCGWLKELEPFNVQVID